MQTNAEHKRIATHKGAAMATKFCGSYKSCLSTLYASHTLSLAGPYTRDSTIANQNARFYLELTWHHLFYRKLTWQIILASHPSSVRVQVLAVLTTSSPITVVLVTARYVRLTTLNFFHHLIGFRGLGQPEPPQSMVNFLKGLVICRTCFPSLPLTSCHFSDLTCLLAILTLYLHF